MHDVVNNNFSSGYLCLIGSIQINLPMGMEDHFLPITFELRHAGKPTVDLLSEIIQFNLPMDMEDHFFAQRIS